MDTEVTALQAFRQQLHSLFPKRKEAIFNLLDALCTRGRQANSVTELSNAPCFERQYSSITDAIANGLPHANWESILKLIDRTITHAPNPAPGNKPIAVGHQYSVIAGLPDAQEAAKKHWILHCLCSESRVTKKGMNAAWNNLQP